MTAANDVILQNDATLTDLCVEGGMQIGRVGGQHRFRTHTPKKSAVGRLLHQAMSASGNSQASVERPTWGRKTDVTERAIEGQVWAILRPPSQGKGASLRRLCAGANKPMCSEVIRVDNDAEAPRVTRLACYRASPSFVDQSNPLAIRQPVRLVFNLAYILT